MTDKVTVTLTGPAKIDGRPRRPDTQIDVAPEIAAQLRAAGVVAPDPAEAFSKTVADAAIGLRDALVQLGPPTGAENREQQNTQRAEDRPEPQGDRAEAREGATGKEPAPTAGEAAATPAPKSRPRKARAKKG